VTAPLRIGIYAPNMARGAPSGVERYVQGLVSGLAALDAPEEFVLFSDGPAPASPRWRRVEVRGMGRLSRLWFDHASLAKAARAERLDVLHCPKSIVPRGLDAPAVLTVHDLIFLRRPQEYGLLWRAYWPRAIRAAASRAAAVICHSEAVRRDVEAYLPDAAPRSRVVPSGVDVARFRDAAPAGGPPYFLFVGNLTRRKNLGILLEAHARTPGAELVLAGSPDFGAPELLARAREAKGVRVVESPDDGALASLYRGALALVHPSKDEGFAFPLLEAMAAGCPVIASTAGALPEVAGDAALLAPPDDAGAFAAAMRRILEEPALRADLAARGRRRAEGYPWRRTAEATLAIYREAAGRRA